MFFINYIDFGGQKENGANEDNAEKTKSKTGAFGVFGKDSFGDADIFKSSSMADGKKSMPANQARGSAATGGGRGYRGIARLDECPNILEGVGASAICEAFHICHSCVTVPECTWHIDQKMTKCQKMKERKLHHPLTRPQLAAIPIKNIGGSSKNVINTDNSKHRKANKTIEMKETKRGNNEDIGSNSDPDDNKPQPPLVGSSGAETSSNAKEVEAIDLVSYDHERGFTSLLSRMHTDSLCESACSDRTTCTDCLQQQCMWCKNLKMCTDRNAYLASFPYGQCMDWTTAQGSCPLPSSKTNGKQTDIWKRIIIGDFNEQFVISVNNPIYLYTILDTSSGDGDEQTVCSGYSTCLSCQEGKQVHTVEKG